jgi:hypothetical protein
MRSPLRLPSLSARDRRTLGRGGLAVGLLLFLGKGVPAWHLWECESRASAAEVVSDATRADMLLATYPSLRDSLRARSARLLTVGPLVVTGDTPATAAATLASLVSDAATDAGVKLGVVQPRADVSAQTALAPRSAPRAEFVRVSVHGDLTGDVVGIAQFLGDLERGPTLLSVRDLAIAQPDPQAASTRMEVLHADFTVFGLALASGRKGADTHGAVPVGADGSVAPGAAGAAR